MPDSEVKVVISGDSTSAQNAMQGAAQAVRDGAAQIKESISGLGEVFKGMQETILGLGAVLAGGGAFKEIVSSTNEWVEASIQISNALGISTEEASAWNIVMKEVGGSAQDLIGATQGLTRQVKTHEKALNDMGIATRDSNGNLLDQKTILESAIEAVNSYAAGTDRNLAAQTAFGRGVNANNPILRVHVDMLAEAAKRADELGLTVGGNTKAAFEANRKAMADVNIVGTAFGVTIGQQLIPVLISLGQAFSGPSTEMAKVFGSVITWVGKGVMGLWYGLKELGTMLGGFGAAANAVIHGNFGEARTIISQLKADLKAMSDEGDKAIEKIGQTMAAASGGGEAGGGKHFNQKLPKDPAADTRLADWKNQLEKMQQAEGDFDQKNLAEQLAFWKEKQAITETGSKEDAKINAEIGKIVLDLKRKQHDEEIKMEEEKIKTTETLALGELNAKQTALEQALALGKITQQQEVAGLIQIENEKFAIEKKALDDKLALMALDAAARQKLNDQEMILAQQHAAALTKITNKAAQDEQKSWNSLFSSMRSGFASTITSFLNGTASLGATIKGLFQDIGNSIIQMIANLAAQWLETSLMQLVMNKTTGAGIIAGLAAQAAAGAFAATAMIPYVGPELAPAAATLAYADVMAFQAMNSAAGGFDIPAGMNPVTQLHAQEMVLPAKYANVIRGMASGQGGGAGGSLTVKAIDARSFAKALGKGGGSSPLAKGLRRLNKGFVGR